MTERILGIDYGDRRVGLALAEMGSIAVPYKVLARTDDEQILAELKEIISVEDINAIVVGLPHSLSGQPNERLEISTKFVEFLKANLNLGISTVDEQLTSKLYSKMGVTKDIDKHAATAILDTFLEQNDRQP